MRCFTASFMMETNTFSPMRASLETFADDMLLRPSELPSTEIGILAPLLDAARRREQTEGWQVVAGTAAFCHPRGTIVKAAYETLRDEILEQLREALPVDIVALNLHGSMVAEGYPDCDGDIATRVREMIGPDVAFGLELDSHCNVSDVMVNTTDAIVAFKEYPHTDFAECAELLIDILTACAQGLTRPTMSVFDCRMIDMFYTTREPFKSYVASLRELERRGDVLAASVAHGFPWGDVPDMGTKILVVTDANRTFGDELAARLGRELFDLRGQTAAQSFSLAEGVRRAIKAASFPVVIADIADNPGGGAPGDSTFVLRELLEQGVKDACFGPLWDPIAVQSCFDAGQGAEIDLRLGGKMGPTSGAPLDLRARIIHLSDDHRQIGLGAEVRLGKSALVDVGGVEIVLTSRRAQAFTPQLFSGIGVKLTAKKIIAVKSTHHFHAGFAPIAAEVLYIDSPGTMAADITLLSYKNIERPKWPFDANLGDI